MSDNVSDPDAGTDAAEDPTESSASLTRRRLMHAGFGVFGVGYAGAIVYPIYRFLQTPVRRAAEAAAVTEVSLEDADKLKPGSALMFLFGNRPALLIHHADGTWTSLDAVCTHLGCTVKYEADEKRIFCACHGGVYDPATGAAVAGPPPKGLKQYKVEVKDGEVLVARS